MKTGTREMVSVPWSLIHELLEGWRNEGFQTTRIPRTSLAINAIAAHVEREYRALTPEQLRSLERLTAPTLGEQARFTDARSRDEAEAAQVHEAQALCKQAGWQLWRSVSTRVVGDAVGEPTRRFYEVILAKVADERVTLSGQGHSMLEAVQAALGVVS